MPSTAKWGGGPITRHNKLRDIVFSACRAAGMLPELEKTGILPGTRERPADVFVSRWPGGGPAALDIAVVSPLKAEYLHGAANASGYAATAYADRKANIEQTERRCREKGVKFVPLVVESFGAWCDESRQVIQQIAGLGAPREEGSLPQDAIRFLFQRLSIELVRSNAQSLLNRNVVVSDTGCPLREAALREVCCLAAELSTPALPTPAPAVPPSHLHLDARRPVPTVRPVHSRHLDRLPHPPPVLSQTLPVSPRPQPQPWLPPSMTPPPGSSGLPSLLPGSSASPRS